MFLKPASISFKVILILAAGVKIWSHPSGIFWPYSLKVTSLIITLSIFSGGMSVRRSNLLNHHTCYFSVFYGKKQEDTCNNSFFNLSFRVSRAGSSGSLLFTPHPQRLSALRACSPFCARVPAFARLTPGSFYRAVHFMTFWEHQY